MFANRYIRGVRVPCVVFYLVAVVLIVLYGVVLRKLRCPDILERKLSESPAWVGADGWALTHFFFWAILGLLYPGHHVQALVVSLIWEGAENILGQSKIEISGRRLQLVGEPTDDEPDPSKSDANEIGANGDDNGIEDANDNSQFWYGRFTTDTCFNMAGYVLGSAAADKWWPGNA